MSLFTGDPIHHVDRLLDIVRDDGTTAVFTTTLTLQHWELLEFRWSFWKRRNSGCENSYRLDISRPFKETFDSIRARRYVSLLPHKLQLPNLRCVRLFFPRSESNWATYQLTRMLSAFPQLTELELTATININMAHVAQCLRDLRGLRKLKILIPFLWDPKRRKAFRETKINCFSRFIATNHNLTHLTFHPRTLKLVDLSGLFLDIPSNRPLVLEHISCNSNCRNFEALLPHIQSLSFFEFQCNKIRALNTWCTTLSDAGIFPPTIKANLLDPQLAEYLKKHPGIVGLSLVGKESHDSIMTTIEHIELCFIVAQHSGTLQYLRMTSPELAQTLRTLQNELNFKQCNNLREIVLCGNYNACYRSALWESDNSYYEKQVLPVLAHLNCSLTVVLQSVEVAIFDACVEFCRKSDDPFVCELAERLVLGPLAADRWGW